MPKLRIEKSVTEGLNSNIEKVCFLRMYWNIFKTSSKIKIRILNLELMLEYGGESWKIYNEVLVDLLNKVNTICHLKE